MARLSRRRQFTRDGEEGSKFEGRCGTASCGADVGAGVTEGQASGGASEKWEKRLAETKRGGVAAKQASLWDGAERATRNEAFAIEADL
jgi:hypothetical protein